MSNMYLMIWHAYKKVSVTIDFLIDGQISSFCPDQPEGKFLSLIIPNDPDEWFLTWNPQWEQWKLNTSCPISKSETSSSWNHCNTYTSIARSSLKHPPVSLEELLKLVSGTYDCMYEATEKFRKLNLRELTETEDAIALYDLVDKLLKINTVSTATIQLAGKAS